MSDISDRWYPRDTTPYEPSHVYPWCEHGKPFLMCSECVAVEESADNRPHRGDNVFDEQMFVGPDDPETL